MPNRSLLYREEEDGEETRTSEGSVGEMDVDPDEDDGAGQGKSFSV